MAELVDVSLLSDLMACGGCGLVYGSLLPLVYRLAGWLVDVVKLVLL